MGGGGGLKQLVNNATPAGWVSGGDLFGDRAASDAKDAQVAAAQQANAAQLQIYNQQRSDAQPWMQAGSQAVGQLQSSMPDLTRQFSASDFHEDPGYQFALDQGMQAMQRSAAAKGSLNSVGTMQNLNNYAQGMASQQYQSAYDRFTGNQQQRYNMLSGLSGQGMVATGMAGAAGQNYANQYGQNMASIGNANAASRMASYNGTMNLINGGMKLGGMAMGMPPGMSPSVGGGGVSNPMAGATPYGGRMAGEPTMTMSNLA